MDHSSGVCHLFSFFLSFYTNSYSIPSFNFAWETPVSYFLAPIVGSLLVLVAHSVSPGMEALAVAPIRAYRCALGFGICIAQWVVIFVGIRLANAFVLATPISSNDAVTLFFATVFFQGIGMLSGALFTSYKAWILPALGFIGCVGFGFNADTTPRPHHVLVIHSTTSAAIVWMLWGIGVASLAVLQPRVE